MLCAGYKPVSSQATAPLPINVRFRAYPFLLYIAEEYASASLKLTEDQTRDRLACTLEKRSESFKKFLRSQNGNMGGDVYKELAEPFAQYVIDCDWREIQRCQ